MESSSPYNILSARLWVLSISLFATLMQSQGRREASLVWGGGGGGDIQIYLIQKICLKFFSCCAQTSAINFVNLTLYIICNLPFYMIVTDFPHSLSNLYIMTGKGYSYYPRRHHGCRGRIRKFSNFDASSSLENALF